VFMLIFRTRLGHIYTSDPEVIEMVGKLMIPVTLSMFFDSAQGVICGILRGMGRQNTGFVINILGYYGVGLTCSLCYSKYLKLEVYGLWWGLVTGLVFVTTCLLIALLRTNWQKEVEDAAERTAEEATGVKQRIDLNPTVRRPLIDEDELTSSSDVEAGSKANPFDRLGSLSPPSVNGNGDAGGGGGGDDEGANGSNTGIASHYQLDASQANEVSVNSRISEIDETEKRPDELSSHVTEPTIGSGKRQLTLN